MVDRAIWIGYNGSIAQQFGIDTLANNIANINTVGYRAQRPTFGDLFVRKDRMATEFTNPIQSGHGAEIASIDSLFHQGELRPSQQFTDVAIAGDGFFVLKDPRLPAVQQSFYTRAGNFAFDAGIADSGSGDPFTSGGQVLFLRDHPTFTTLPRLVDVATGRVVQGYLADSDGVLQTSTVTDLTVNPAARDDAKETTAYTVAGTLESEPPAYQLSLMTDSTNAQLSTFSGTFNGNQDRGTLSVTWNSDGSGTWKFLKIGQTVPDAQNTATFSANTVKVNTQHSFIPGVTFKTQDIVTLQAGSFTAQVGPFDIDKNTTVISSVEGAYLGNLSDGQLTITTTATGAVSWSFVPEGKTFISESGSGTFTSAESATTTIIPGLTLRKTAGTSLTSGSLILNTDHSADATGSVGPFFDDDSPNTQHALLTTFKQIAQNEYGYTVSGQTTEQFSDSSIATLSNGQKRVTTYANIDPNQVTVRRVSDNFTLGMASSKVTTDAGSNIVPSSVRGAYWSTTSDLSGNITLTINADGSGSYSFTPVGQVQATATGTIAAGTLAANTTYALANGNEVIPGLVFTTNSALAAGSVVFESTIGSYSTFNNQLTFSPSFSNKISTSTTSFLVDYKFASDTFTNSSATTGTNRYFGRAAFDANGRFDSANSSAPNITFTPNSTTDTLTITPTLSNILQASGGPALDVTVVDGNLEGFLLQLEFSDLGRLRGVFSNAREKDMAQLVLARFRNPGGLSRTGDTAFQETISSGAATVQSVEQMSPGIARIVPKELEYSNSNLADELSDLIFYQRAFQFSGRAIRAADELTQNAINLKR